MSLLLTGKVLKTTAGGLNVTVQVERVLSHKKYHKVLRVKSEFYARNLVSDVLECGDNVVIKSCRPYSKTIAWQVVNKL
jgi:small subunit ribosomal protein S17